MGTDRVPQRLPDVAAFSDAWDRFLLALRRSQARGARTEESALRRNFVQQGIIEEMLRQTPLGKLGGATDLMGAALLLASDAGGHITGQTLVIDGGATII